MGGGEFRRPGEGAGFRPAGRVTLPMAARRRKVHSTPFPPGGENCVRSLAPPLPGEPASLGFAGSNEGLGKAPPGTAPDEHFVLIVAHPTPSGPSGHLPLTGGVGPGPHSEGYPLDRAKHFRRAKSEWLVPISTGPLGPGFAKIIAGAFSLPRLALPSKRWLVRIPAGAPRGSPTRFRKISLKPVEEGLAPPAQAFPWGKVPQCSHWGG